MATEPSDHEDRVSEQTGDRWTQKTSDLHASPEHSPAMLFRF